MQETLSLFGQEVEDAAEETFDLFSQTTSTGDLGMLDPKAASLDLTIRGRDFTLTQSPGLLQSDREGGTTGAAVWATSVRVAQWIADPENVLFKQKVLGQTSTVLELGSGISGVVGCVLASRVERLVLTDQQYTLKLLKENVAANTPKNRKQARGSSSHKDASSNIVIEPLDWETDSIAPFLSLNGLMTGVDLVLACDCIYNYALIEPFTQACADICRVRQQASELDGLQPTVCVVAQHLRQPDVFEEWAEVFLRTFRTWRISAELLNEALGEGSGFSVHIAVLK